MGIRRFQRVLFTVGVCVGFMTQGCFLFPPSANFLIEASPSAITAEPGERITINAVLTCGYLFDETVAVSVLAPSGFSFDPGDLNFAPQSCGGDKGSLREYPIRFRLRVVAAPGTHTLTVRGSTGDERHDATVAVTVGVDEESPTVSMTSPAAVVASSPVSIFGFAQDNIGIVRITRSLDGGQEVDLTGWSDLSSAGLSTPFSGSLDVTPGPHTLVIRAYDLSGNVGSAAREFVLDTGENEPPTVAISRPTNDAMYASSEAVVFVGSATDAEDGTLPGSALVWTSNADGELGFGPEISVMGLSVGTHVITLTATDSDGASASATVTIHVTETGYECSMFTFVVTPDELSVPIGGSATASITLVRGTGFTAPVTWTLNSATGASLEAIFDTRDFDPPVSTDNMTTLTLSPGVEASAGATFSLIVRGQSEVPAAVCTQPLTVTFVDP